MWELREQHTHKAKKPYTCDTCGKPIEIEMSYVRQRQTDMETGKRLVSRFHVGETCNPHHNTKKS